MRVNKKMKQGRAALGAHRRARRAASSPSSTTSRFEAPEDQATRSTLLVALELDGKVLVVLPQPTDDGAVEKSFRNLRR